MLNVPTIAVPTNHATVAGIIGVRQYPNQARHIVIAAASNVVAASRTVTKGLAAIFTPSMTIPRPLGIASATASAELSTRASPSGGVQIRNCPGRTEKIDASGGRAPRAGLRLAAVWRHALRHGVSSMSATRQRTSTSAAGAWPVDRRSFCLPARYSSVSTPCRASGSSRSSSASLASNSGTPRSPGAHDRLLHQLVRMVGQRADTRPVDTLGDRPKLPRGIVNSKRSSSGSFSVLARCGSSVPRRAAPRSIGAPPPLRRGFCKRPIDSGPGSTTGLTYRSLARRLTPAHKPDQAQRGEPPTRRGCRG